ncbi:hypothetical protein M8J76_000842 [Diaphorina citri]|nr:hypothetical protein M8J76_000842 [Diaphorina citri]
MPSTEYQISVRVYAEDSISKSESKPIIVTTYSEPSNISLLQKTAYVLLLKWKHNYLYRRTHKGNPIIIRYLTYYAEALVHSKHMVYTRVCVVS